MQSPVDWSDLHIRVPHWRDPRLVQFGGIVASHVVIFTLVDQHLNEQQHLERHPALLMVFPDCSHLPGPFHQRPVWDAP